jgi:hypothetical protein
VLPPLERLLRNGAAGARARGDHERIEAAERLDRRRDHVSDVRLDAGVAGQREPVELAGHGAQRLGAATRDRDAVAVRGEPPRDGRADAGAAAGDESRLHSVRTVSRSSTV